MQNLSTYSIYIKSNSCLFASVTITLFLKDDEEVNNLTYITREGKIEWDTTKPDGTPQKLLDSSRFLKFGWNSSISLEEGLETTHQWFINNFKKAS